MIKKLLSKMVLTTVLCTLLMVSTVSAANASFDFKLCNTGTSVTHFSTKYNKKVYTSHPWTLKVDSITAAGYGVRYMPAKYNTSTGNSVACTQSGVWKSTTGGLHVSYAASDAALTNYTVGVRQDDDYYWSFYTKGWFNADSVSY